MPGPTRSVELAHTATQYLANALTFSRGGPSDVVSVGAYYGSDPNTVPEVADFTAGTLVQPGDALAEGDLIDIVVLVGPRDGDITLVAGDYQVWLLITTAKEDVILKMDTVTIL